MAVSQNVLSVRCRSCQCLLPGWLRIPNVPNSTMLLHHLSQQHPKEVGPYLRRMATECIDTVVMEAFKRITAA